MDSYQMPGPSNRNTARSTFFFLKICNLDGVLGANKAKKKKKKKYEKSDQFFPKYLCVFMHSGVFLV